MRAALNMLTPLGWAAAVATAVGLALLVLGGLGFRWDPLGLWQRRLEAAEARAEIGRDEAVARRLETEAQADQLRRVDRLQQQQTAVGRTTAAVIEQARSAEDAHEPLESGRSNRLRGHDRQLCRLTPSLDGCAGAAGAAGDGEAALRPGDLAG
jgi:hypothetical protein